MKKTALVTLGLLLIFSAILFWGNTLAIMLESNNPSKSIGSTSKGSLINGKRLPSNGSNFLTYSYLGSLIGRTCVHHKVRDVILETYQALAKDFPEKQFMYGETGWPGGGKFAPHRTHQNGLSVDFMVPVLTNAGEAIKFPSSIFNKFGYSIEFDINGKTDGYQIDFEIMAAHIYYLSKYCKENGIRIRRIIFDPKLQPKLFSTAFGRKIQGQISFNSRQAWVRHDEHYHVDFQL